MFPFSVQRIRHASLTSNYRICLSPKPNVLRERFSVCLKMWINSSGRFTGSVIVILGFCSLHCSPRAQCCIAEVNRILSVDCNGSRIRSIDLQWICIKPMTIQAVTVKGAHGNWTPKSLGFPSPELKPAVLCVRNPIAIYLYNGRS